MGSLRRKHLDLFSGIGGFALAARWAGIETIGFCEIDKYAQKVLAKNFPGVPIYEDVTKLDGSEFKDIFLITGGFPCQDISIAGKGAGIEGERSGLWSELHRIIGEVRPKYVLIENVPALTFRGGARVIADLAEIGYDTEWQIVGADDVGAPHRRKRIWIVAYANCESESNVSQHEQWMETEDVAYTESKGGECRETRITGIKTQCGEGIPRWSSSGNVAYTKSKRVEGYRSSREQKSHTYGQKGLSICESERPGVAERITRPSIRGMVDGIPEGLHKDVMWQKEPEDINRVSVGVKDRSQRLHGLGNSICPQVAYEIIRCLK